MREAEYPEAAKISEIPSRVALAVSFDRANKRPNIIALGWKMRTSMNPPMAAVSIAKTRHSHGLILREKEFVLAFPGEDIAQEVLFCGTTSGRSVDKFRDTGLLPAESKHITPPLIAGCPVNYECRVSGVLETGDHTIFSGEVLASHVSKRKKLLVSAGEDEGYRIVLEGKGYRFGVIK